MFRQIALVAVVALAVLVLLGGLASLTTPATSTDASLPTDPAAANATGSGSGGPPTASSSPVPSASVIPVAPTLAPGSDPVFVGAGDIATCDLDGDEETARLLDTIAGTVFAAGDNVYPDGTGQQFADCYGPTWGRHLDRTYAVPGNHDWHDKDLAGYLGYFGTRGAPTGTTWYSVDAGTWHVVMLDSQCGKIGGCGADSPQGRWLAADLAASTARCTLAIWHKPRWSSGTHGDDTTSAPFWDALYAAGADVVVNGHEHDYERFAPQDPAGREDRVRGLREFVVGTGGAELRKFEETAANSEIRVGGTYGVLKLTLKANGYDWAFIPVSGDVSDAGSGPCH